MPVCAIIVPIGRAPPLSSARALAARASWLEGSETLVILDARAAGATEVEADRLAIATVLGAAQILTWTGAEANIAELREALEAASRRGHVPAEPVAFQSPLRLPPGPWIDLEIDVLESAGASLGTGSSCGTAAERSFPPSSKRSPST